MRPTALTMMINIAPYRDAFLDLVSGTEKYVSSELFAMQVLTLLLRNQLGTVVDLDREIVQYDRYQQELKYVVERTSSQTSLWRPLRRTVLADPDFIVHDIQYRHAGNRFLIMGSYE